MEKELFRYELAYELYKNNAPLAEIVKITNLNEDALKIFLRKFEIKMLKKKVKSAKKKIKKIEKEN